MGEVKDYKDREVFLIYLEDDGRQVSAYVNVIELKDGLITFKTNKNIISIPVARIVKIKARFEDEN